MDSELLNEFYKKYRGEIYLYLLSLSHDTQTAEDLTQETFLKALLSLQNKNRNVRAWLYVVARNLYFNYRKKQSALTELTDDREDGKESVPDAIIRDEYLKAMYSAIGKIDVRKREVIELAYFSHMTQKEIAVILNISCENVRVLTFRAKKELRRILEEDGYDLP